MVTNLINNGKLAANCEAMLGEHITYEQMDCQASVEEAYRRTGMTLKDVDLAGSNTHYRNDVWRGTPERCRELLGVNEVPVGTEVYIVLNDGGEPAKYRNDGKGNASHMGLYLGNGRTFNSSEKNKGVCVSTKFNGKKAVPNGGFNMVGFKSYVDYGLNESQLAALRADANYTGIGATSDASSGISTDAATVTVGPVDTSDFYLVKRGCKGGAVQRLQEWLARDLGYGIVVDHDFGPATEAAVELFQTAHGLDADGVVGRKTWAALAQARYNEHENGVSG